MSETNRQEFIKRYFSNSCDYPDPTAEFLGDNEFGGLFGDDFLLSYISNSFLSGWINYVQIVQARVIGRYKDRGSPAELVAKYLAREDRHHTRFLDFGDDVAVLARDKSGRWWYFYYDQDVSDCQIGRFRTDGDDATVVQLFEAHCGESAIIPADCINGWKS